MMQFIFFGSSVVALLAGHVFLWFIIVDFFGLTGFSSRLAVALAVVFLLLSVIISSILIHKRDNAVTRWYYILSGFGIGLAVNALLVAILILAVKYLAGLVGFLIPDLISNAVLIAGSSIVSLAGVYRAIFPRVVEYDVKIKDLPEIWDNKVVVQVSDIHLGPVYRRHSLRRLISKINVLKPEAVFVTGDLFDGMESDFSWIHHPLNHLEAPKGVYYGFGNHDLYLGFDRVVHLLKNNRAIILDNRLEMVDGLQIIGVNYSFDNNFDLEKAILAQVGYSENKPSILLFHAPKNVSLAKSAGIDLQLSGHTHDGQMWPGNLIAKWMHRGYGYGFFTEGDFNLIVSSGAGSWGPPMRTSARSEIVKIILHKK